MPHRRLSTKKSQNPNDYKKFTTPQRQYQIVAVYQSTSYDVDRVQSEYYRKLFVFSGLEMRPFDNPLLRGRIVAVAVFAERHWCTIQDMKFPWVEGPLVDDIEYVCPLVNPIPLDETHKAPQNVRPLTKLEKRQLFAQNPLSKRMIDLWKVKMYPHLEEKVMTLKSFKQPWGQCIAHCFKFFENHHSNSNWKIDGRYETSAPPNNNYQCRKCIQFDQWQLSCKCHELAQKQKQKEKVCIQISILIGPQI